MTTSLSIDFETYSEAGYVWDADRNRWRSLVPKKPGLKGVGTVVYSEHPSTEVICLAYGDRLWRPGLPLPTDLFTHIAAGGMVTAWFSSFEYYIWKNVCVPMGWPELPYEQLRCSMAAARGWGLPGQLEKAGSALHTPIQKDKRGKQLLTQLTQPRTPTKTDASLRRTVTTHPDAHAEFYRYCLTDVQAESGIAAVTPPLSDTEQAVWLLDQKINYRGMAVDRQALDDCIEIVRLATVAGTEELRRLTMDAGMTIGMTAKIKGWLKGCQLDLPDLQKETVADALATDSLTAPQRRVLELRASLSASSVAKLQAILHQTGRSGRVHGLLAYCGAERTGRWAGRGPQPQNLPRGRWSAEGVEGALAVIATRDLSVVTALLGDPIAAVSSCLRGLFVAAPGYELICSDYSAIEAVVLAAMAGESWRMEVFRTHGKIYESSASKITGIPMSEFKAHYERTGKHHPMRNKIGKVAELACLGADTEVLTDSGWKRIVDVELTDKIHDGIDWVAHEGVVDRGERLTLKIGSVTVTPEHKFYISEGVWLTAEDLKGNTDFLTLALDTASSLLLISSLKWPPRDFLVSNVGVAAEEKTYTISTIFEQGSPLDVISAPKLNPPHLVLATDKSALTGGIDVDYWGVFQRQWAAALARTIGNMPLTVEEVLRSILDGWKTGINGLLICAPWMGGTTPAPLSTVLTTISVTCPEILDSFRTENNKTTSAKPDGFITKAIRCLLPNFIGNIVLGTRKAVLSSENSPKAKPPRKSSRGKPSVKAHTARVYDILNSGPRNRFVIRTSHGPLIAHNSGYQGGYRAWQQFGAGEHMDEDELKRHVTAWREASPMIVKFWYGLERAAQQAVGYPGTVAGYRGVSYQCRSGVLYARLPSGRELAYHEPELRPAVTPWGAQVIKLSFMGWESTVQKWQRVDTYGGKLTENIIQAVARDILAHGMLALDLAGYEIVLHVHDEVVCEVHRGQGSIAQVEKIMSTMPAWCADWPIRAAGGWRGHRYRKD